MDYWSIFHTLFNEAFGIDTHYCCAMRCFAFTSLQAAVQQCLLCRGGFLHTPHPVFWGSFLSSFFFFFALKCLAASWSGTHVARVVNGLFVLPWALVLSLYLYVFHTPQSLKIKLVPCFYFFLSFWRPIRSHTFLASHLTSSGRRRPGSVGRPLAGCKRVFFALTCYLLAIYLKPYTIWTCGL